MFTFSHAINLTL